MSYIVLQVTKYGDLRSPGYHKGREAARWFISVFPYGRHGESPGQYGLWFPDGGQMSDSALSAINCLMLKRTGMVMVKGRSISHFPETDMARSIYCNEKA